MTESELYWSINYAEGIIDANNDKIRQLEKDYDDLLSLKRGLGNVFAKHEEVYTKNKNAMNDSAEVAGAVSTPIEAGKIKIFANVNASYKLKQ